MKYLIILITTVLLSCSFEATCPVQNSSTNDEILNLKWIGTDNIECLSYVYFIEGTTLPLQVCPTNIPIICSEIKLYLNVSSSGVSGSNNNYHYNYYLLTYSRIEAPTITYQTLLNFVEPYIWEEFE